MVRWLSRVAQISVIGFLSIGASLIAPGIAQADTGPTDPAICSSWASGPWRNNCEVQQGDQNNLVLAVQEIVSGACGGGGIATDGDFGQATYHAVTCFQAQHHLGNDGIVGPNTWAALRGAISPAENDVDPNWNYFVIGVILPGQREFRQWVDSGNWYVENDDLVWVPMRTF